MKNPAKYLPALNEALADMGERLPRIFRTAYFVRGEEKTCIYAEQGKDGLYKLMRLTLLPADEKLEMLDKGLGYGRALAHLKEAEKCYAGIDGSECQPDLERVYLPHFSVVEEWHKSRKNLTLHRYFGRR